MLNNFKRLTASVLIAMSAHGVVAEESAEQPQTLVTVDGFPVTNLHFALFASQTGRATDDPEEQLNLLNELVNHFMVANSAQGKELAAHPEVAAALEVARARLIAQTFVRSELEKVQIDEQQLQKLYDEQYGSASNMEYKARHILVAKEDEAKQIIDELKQGADFAELAAAKSIGPSKTVGGDLGWFEADQMVSEFSEATVNLADGAFSEAPVKTQFGWHVILREESRKAAPPSFESVKSDLERELQQEHVARAVNAIRDQTKIEIQRAE